MNVMRRIKELLLALLLALALVAPSLAATVTVDLVAEQVNVTMSDATSVPMWKLRRNTDPPGSAPPVIAAVAGDTLVINLTNNLAGPTAEPVSLVINGQTPSSMTPTWTDGTTGPRTSVSQRIRSFTHETAANGGTATYQWPSLKAGTYLLASGTHIGVQVPMGLYAAVKVDAAAGQAYNAETAYTGEAVLLFSEVDPALNSAVAGGTYGTPAFTTALGMKSEPKYFLINGSSFAAASPPLAVAGPGQTSLLRFLNAGNNTRVPVIQNEYMSLIAEDGHLLPDAFEAYSLELAAGRTIDVLINPTTAGLLSIHDRAGGLAGGGMLAHLQVSDGGGLINHTAFVEQLYRTFLGRTGTPVEIQGWVDQLNAGALTEAQVVDGIMNLGEYAGRVPPIERLYFATFDRIPDYDGLMYWVNRLAQGLSLTAIAEIFAGSPEFLATYGSLTNEGYVTQLYQNVLGRTPDAVELAFWAGQLNSGAMTRGAVLANFSESAEFQTLAANRVYVVGAYAGLLRRPPAQGEYGNWVAFLDGAGSQLVFLDSLLTSFEFAQIATTPLQDNATFVSMSYNDFLGRPGTPAEIQSWVGQLDAATLTRSQVVDGIMNLAEYVGREPPIVRLYYATFNRTPDHDGLNYWADQLMLGTSLVAIAEFFAASPEFQATYGALTNAEYITLLYQNVLGRLPDAEGLSFWTGVLDQGLMTRGEVLANFSESAEFQLLTANKVYVVGAYDGLLLRVPAQVELDTAVAILDGGGSRTVFIDGLLGSNEYLMRTGP